MRFLLDENLSVVTARLLAEAGHDVVAVADVAAGASDPDVIALARTTARVLVTFDSDIGARLVRHGDPPPPGVVYLRFVPTDPAHVAERLLGVATLLPPVDAGLYVTVKRDHLRVRSVGGQTG